MNVELLEKVKEHILANPERLDMYSFMRLSNGLQTSGFIEDDVDGVNAIPSTGCNTVGCIAGWTLALSNPSYFNIRCLVDERRRRWNLAVHQTRLNLPVYESAEEIEKNAAKELDISEEYLDGYDVPLFHLNRWPEELRKIYVATHLLLKADEVEEVDKHKLRQHLAKITARAIDLFIADPVKFRDGYEFDWYDVYDLESKA